jgi:rhamnulokinase
MLNQFTADATGIPVEAGPVEATALGNILVQAIAKGRITSIEEGRAMVARSFPITRYDPMDTLKWNEIFTATKFIT